MLFRLLIALRRAVVSRTTSECRPAPSRGARFRCRRAAGGRSEGPPEGTQSAIHARLGGGPQESRTPDFRRAKATLPSAEQRQRVPPSTIQCRAFRFHEGCRRVAEGGRRNPSECTGPLHLRLERGGVRGPCRVCPLRSTYLFDVTGGISLTLGDGWRYLELRRWPEAGKRSPLHIAQEEAANRIAGLVV